MSDPRGRPELSSPWQWFLPNLALIATVGAAFLPVIHLLVVSAGNPSTAYGLLAASSPGTVITATLVTAVPALYIAVLNLCIYVLIFRTEFLSFELRITSWILFGYLFLGALLICPSYAILTIALLIGGFLYLKKDGLTLPIRLLNPASSRTSTTSQGNGLPIPYSAWFSAIFLGALLLPFVSGLFARNMWVPAEEVKTSTGQHFVGYIVGEQGGWTTIMQRRNQRILTIPSDDLTERTICEVRIQWRFERPLISEPRPYPKCPRL